MATLQDYLGITKLRDAWPKWKANVIAVNNQVIAHVAGSADKHAAQDITYTGSFTGKTDVKAALDQAKTEIDTIVISASIDPEVAFARESLVKAKTFGTLDARLEESEQDLVSYQAETASVRKVFPIIAGVVDYTASLQALINSFGDVGGRIIPTGGIKYIFKGTLVIPKNIVIDGIAQFNSETNAGGLNYNTVIFSHEPVNPNTDFIIGGAVQGNGYISGIGIKNINIMGNANSRYGIKPDYATDLLIENVISNGFVDAIVITGWMHCKLSNVKTLNSINSGIRFTGSITTTTILENCYLRASAWGLIAEANTCLGVSFNNCIYESCTEGGIDIHVDNKITIVNPDAENIPTVSSAKSVIQIGVNGTPIDVNYPKGVVTIIGGNLAGCNSGIDANSSIFNVDNVASLTVIGLLAQRAGKLIKTTANTKLVTMVGISEIQITSTKGGIFDKSKVMFLGYNENGGIFNADDISLKPNQTIVNLTYYVATTGSNSNDGLTVGTPFLTIARAVSMIPQIVNHVVTINVASGSYAEPISLSGYVGKGSILISGGVDLTTAVNFIVQYTSFKNCGIRVYASGFIASTTTASSFDNVDCIDAYYRYCTATSVSATSGFQFANSVAYLINCLVSNKAIVLHANVLSRVLSRDWTAGTGNTTGIVANYASTVGKSGVQPQGTTAESVSGGGVIR